VYRNYEFGPRNGEIVLATAAATVARSGVRGRWGYGGFSGSGGGDEGRTRVHG